MQGVCVTGWNECCSGVFLGGEREKANLREGEMALGRRWLRAAAAAALPKGEGREREGMGDLCMFLGGLLIRK